MSLPVVTRFAPSPTGYLHIGGARTALFNWAFAKHTGGKMLLRIEDTDRERSTDAAIEAIIAGMTWLGLTWDGDAVSQHARANRHREVAEQLLASGHAYHCYCSPQELDAMRAKAEAEKRPIRYDGTWRDRDPKDAPAGVKPVIRFKAPQQGETVIDDNAQGRVVFANRDLDDLIILRSDGNPTYNLSVVVDDHDMGVTHIIRGVDHLTNAARQTQIYLAMGWTVPNMTHVPLIHGPDGAKLSKRHGALGVEAYRAMGYLPAALRNYLARLGWSHGDDEIFPRPSWWSGLNSATSGNRRRVLILPSLRTSMAITSAIWMMIHWWMSSLHFFRMRKVALKCWHGLTTQSVANCARPWLASRSGPRHWLNSKLVLRFCLPCGLLPWMKRPSRSSPMAARLPCRN